MRSIPEYLRHGNYRLHRLVAGDNFIILVLILVGLASFGLGRLSVLEESREDVYIRNVPQEGQMGTVSRAAGNSEPLGPSGDRGLLVGSVNSDKYHYPWCSGAQRIAEGNKVWFNSKEEALAAGYTAAGNCKGLE